MNSDSLKLMSDKHNNIIVVDLLEDRNKELYKQGMDIDASNRTNHVNLQQIVLEIAANTEKLILTKTPGYNWPVNCILNAIINEFQKRGAGTKTIDEIYGIFSHSDYDKYKTHTYSSQRRQALLEQGRSYADTYEKYAADRQVSEAINIFEAHRDNPKLQEYMQKQFSQIKKDETKVRKEKEETTKARIELPDWIDKEQGGADSLTLQAILNLRDTLKQFANRVFKYPPKNPEDDKYFAEGVNIFAELLEPGTDLKFTRDYLSYFDVIHEMYSQSVHSAKSKSKKLTSRGEMRGLTREQIGDMASRVLIVAHKTIEYIPALFRLNIYLRDYQKPFSAQLHVDRHEKLSESAFGGGSFMDN